MKKKVTILVVLLLLASCLLQSRAFAVVARTWPDTQSGVHVFNDQLPSGMADTMVQFSATHYAGTQKMTRAEADRLRAVNPNFLILHYRLGPGLGYRAVTSGCQPNGDWIHIIEGDWVQEWPGDSNVSSSWFFPYSGHARVFNCDWGWYLMELNDTGFRNFWQGEVSRQLHVNDDDGVFMDSLSVPNFMGAASFDPPLPDLDPSFESAWTGRINNWLSWLQTQAVGGYYIIPNTGAWINSRDTVHYALADGVMIEGFALEADMSPYALSDWQLQMNRALSLVSLGKTVIAQAYIGGAQERMYALGSYLLIKGSKTYMNIEYSMEPEWWPEYDIPIGAPTEGAGTDISNLYRDSVGVYSRNFTNGFVLVNPTNPWDGTGTTVDVDLGGTYYLAQTSGGGVVPDTGIPDGSVSYQEVSNVTLPPYSAAVLFNTLPSGDPPPVIQSVTKLSQPFRLKLIGANFQPGCQVYVGTSSTPWTSVTYTSASTLVLNGGRKLKRKFPLDTTVRIRVVNPDGGQGSTTYRRRR